MKTINDLQSAAANENFPQSGKVEPKRGKNRPPTKPTNLSRRPREYLEQEEVDAVRHAAKRKDGRARYKLRDEALVLLACRHGLRAAELVSLKWSQIDLGRHRIHVVRVKNGDPSVHPMEPDEKKLLAKLLAWYHNKSRAKTGIATTPVYVFTSERGTAMTRRNVHYLVSNLGIEAQLESPLHTHQFRHTAGYDLINNRNMPLVVAAAFLGHRKVENTRRYTTLGPQPFDPYFGQIGRRTQE
jgi:type 1 fimbriae regulatory protein FimE